MSKYLILRISEKTGRVLSGETLPQRNDSMIILVFLFFIIYSILAWRRLDWATVLIILALPSYLIRFKIFGIPMTILEAMILTAFFVWFIKETNFLNFLRGRYKIKNYLENRKTRDRNCHCWF